METISWCLSIKNGIELVEQNKNLSLAYLKKAEDSLKVLSQISESREWKITSAYYSMYFSLYSILMKIGIKCENHGCTLAFMRELLKDYFEEIDIENIEEARVLRVDALYYADREVPSEKYKNLLKNAPLFFVKCKEVLIKIKEEDIKAIREKIRVLKEEQIKKKQK